MKIALRILGLLAIFVTAAFGVRLFIPSLAAPAQGWALSHGIIPVDKADWGYLKLRSGLYGLKVLADLEHNAPQGVARVAVAVQTQWRARGYYTDTPGDPTFNGETRFQDLRLPPDGKALPQYLPKGMTIPDRFWRVARFRSGCKTPPQTAGRKDICRWRMMDLTGDGNPEIILDHAVTYGREAFPTPAIGEDWHIFTQDRSGWRPAAFLPFCAIPSHAATDAFVETKVRMDEVSIDGVPANFFNAECAVSKTVESPQPSRTMASLLQQIPLLKGSHPIPSSLVVALSKQTVLQPIDSGASQVLIPALHPSKYRSLPDCFVWRSPKSCAAFVRDLDHDGVDDIIILDEAVMPGAPHGWRWGTLLTQKEEVWQVMSSRPICANANTKLAATRVDTHAPDYLTLNYAGRLYDPGQGPSVCKYQAPIL